MQTPSILVKKNIVIKLVAAVLLLVVVVIMMMIMMMMIQWSFSGDKSFPPHYRVTPKFRMHSAHSLHTCCYTQGSVCHFYVSESPCYRFVHSCTSFRRDGTLWREILSECGLPGSNPHRCHSPQGHKYPARCIRMKRCADR